MYNVCAEKKNSRGTMLKQADLEWLDISHTNVPTCRILCLDFNYNKEKCLPFHKCSSKLLSEFLNFVTFYT
jgi:hypothetical protein